MAKQSKDAKPGKNAGPKASRGEKLKQIGAAYQITKERDPRLPLFLAGAFLVGAAVIEVLGWLSGHVFIAIIPAVLIGVMTAMIIFGRRAQKAAFTQVEGQPGAAAWVIQGLRGDWRKELTVAANAQLDTVHRLIGKPGIVLVGEGAPHRVRALLAQEKKRTARIAGDTPIYDIVTGDEEGQVPLKKLSQHLIKLPRNIDSKQVGSLENRLQALSGPRKALPKGPLPAKAQRSINERTIRRR
ncbi:MAG TPA: DUF4191 domain-containing protein [Mycobacteriales bacterium]|nr:DUF4191 domain-containing protein [Mycobacteriales bacterium]